jgi:hypothetical protein
MPICPFNWLRNIIGWLIRALCPIGMLPTTLLGDWQNWNELSGILHGGADGG